MVGDETVVLEANGMGFSRPREIGSFSLAGSPKAGGALGVFLQVFKNRHDCPP
jgi:hypothetical protein